MNANMRIDKIDKFFKKDKPCGTCGNGTLNDPQIIWLKEPTDPTLKVGVEQVLHLLARKEALTHVWLRGGTPPYAQYHSTTTTTGGDIVDDDDHLTVYCRRVGGQLLEGHVYCVIDGQSGKFMAEEDRKHAQADEKGPVKLHNFDLGLGLKRGKKLTERLLLDYNNWRERPEPLSQQNA